MDVDIRTDRGSFACMDFGGSGPHCLLIHGTGQNALAWQSFAEALGPEFRVVAFDMRGHGQTLEVSANAQQYWQDIGAVAAALAMEEPILIGHSTGAYAAAAYVASGGRASSLVCVDGFTLDSDCEARAAARNVSPDRAGRELFDMFRYGWRATEAERDAYIEEVVEGAPGDWLNEGLEPNLLRAMLRRCFVRDGNRWLRRPTLDEIGVVSAPDPDADIFPSRKIYDRISIPMLLVWADGGLSGERHAEISRIAESAPNRRLIDMHGSHNLPMQQPEELARLIASHLLSGAARARADVNTRSER